MAGEFAWLWGPAFDKEMHNHQVKHQTWRLEKLPRGRKMAKSRWVCDYQFHGSEFIKAKARFVVCGYSQKEGEDYFETFSATPRWDSVRLAIALGAQFNLGYDMADVSAAFLYAPMKEEVYVQQPPGFEVKGSGDYTLACLLLLSLYGAKQSCCNWGGVRNDELFGLGFRQMKHDPCMFIKGEGPEDPEFLIHLVHVDDSLTFGRDAARAAFLKKWCEIFKCEVATDKFFLGCEINQGKGFYKIDQTQYIKRLLVTHGMEECNMVATPMEAGATFLKATEETVLQENIRPIVGALRYAVITRFDILTAVGIVSRHANAPTVEIVAAIKRIMRYLKGTTKFGLIYQKGKNGVSLHGYVDANFAGDINDRKSTTGLCFYLNEYSNPITAMSTIQSCIATSTCHAEYMAAYKAVIFAVWCRGLLEEMGVAKDKDATRIYEDNSAAIALAENPVNHKTTLHFAVKYFYVREQSKAGFIRLVKIGTNDQVADGLSKPMSKIKFDETVHCFAANKQEEVTVRHLLE